MARALNCSARLIPRHNILPVLWQSFLTLSQAFEEAKSMKKFITENYESEIGVAHSLTMASRLSEVDSLINAADSSGAKDLLSQVCGVYTKYYSAYHLKTLECQVRLARLNREAGRLGEAEKLLMGTAQNLADSTNGISEFAIRVEVDLAEIYWERGEYQASKDKLSALILTARQIGATDLSYVGKNYLSRVLASEGELDSAQLVSEDVIGTANQLGRRIPFNTTMRYLGWVRSTSVKVCSKKQKRFLKKPCSLCLRSRVNTIPLHSLP